MRLIPGQSESGPNASCILKDAERCRILLIGPRQFLRRHSYLKRAGVWDVRQLERALGGAHWPSARSLRPRLTRDPPLICGKTLSPHEMNLRRASISQNPLRQRYEPL